MYHIILTADKTKINENSEKFKSFETINELRDELSDWSYHIKYKWWYFEISEHLWEKDASYEKEELIIKAIKKLETPNTLIKSSLRVDHTNYVYLLQEV